ncbi:MAG: ribosome small subunit-dependent GTPase A [Clostridia bacterium]|nr:ribosome small subunit-dependent GTPase A [Clostridia bacterium]
MENIVNKARITEIKLNKYILHDLANPDKIYEGIIKGTLKSKEKSLNVGDIVSLRQMYDTWLIDSVLPRKNKIIRPPVSNIDQMILVIALTNPKPDYLLLDKELAFCFSKNINPIICVNKIDLKDQDESYSNELEYIKNTYEKLGVKVVYISVKNNVGINDLNNILTNNITALCGSSGVGKSSITKFILKNHDIQIGELTSNSKKGKHTTKQVNLYLVEYLVNAYILDTPGFSEYDLYDIEYKDLKLYYPEFLKDKCKYLDCMHVNESESECTIKKLVKENKVDMLRYYRYVEIYLKLKENYDRKYK